MDDRRIGFGSYVFNRAIWMREVQKIMTSPRYIGFVGSYLFKPAAEGRKESSGKAKAGKGRLHRFDDGSTGPICFLTQARGLPQRKADLVCDVVGTVSGEVVDQIDVCSEEYAKLPPDRIVGAEKEAPPKDLVEKEAPKGSLKSKKR